MAFPEDALLYLWTDFDSEQGRGPNQKKKSAIQFISLIIYVRSRELQDQLQNRHSIDTMRAIRKVTSGELLTKQAMREKYYYTKNTYILKLLLNVVATGIEVLVV
jgi:hypothetical protein